VFVVYRFFVGFLAYFCRVCRDVMNELVGEQGQKFAGFSADSDCGACGLDIIVVGGLCFDGWCFFFFYFAFPFARSCGAGC